MALMAVSPVGSGWHCSSCPLLCVRHRWSAEHRPGLVKREYDVRHAVNVLVSLQGTAVCLTHIISEITTLDKSLNIF